MLQKDKNIENMRSVIVKELYAPYRVKYKTRRIELRGFNDLLEVDLADFSKLKSFNDNNTFVLVAINAFSRKVYTEPLKNKTGKEVVRAMKKNLDRAKTKFIHLFSDSGKEFFCSEFLNNIVKPYGLIHYTTKSNHHASHCERYVKSLKTMIYKYLDLKGTNRYIDVLQKITEQLNNRAHSRYKFIPNKVTEKDEKRLLKIFNKKRPLAKKVKFKINQQVRISEIPKHFRRAFLPYWSTNLYTIKAINRKEPVVYTLADHSGKILPRKYYTEQLQLTKARDCYLVEKIVKKKGNKVLVRYLGYGPEFDEWVENENFFDVEKED